MCRIFPSFLSLCVVAIIVAVAGCQPIDAGSTIGRARDLDGKLLGWQIWRTVSPGKARLQLTGDSRLVREREAVTLDSRYQERWALEGGHLYYAALAPQRGFPATHADPSFLVRLYGDDDRLSDRGMRLRVDQVRWEGRMLFASLISSSHNCVVFAIFAGEKRFEGSPGSSLLRGGLCADQTLSTIEDVNIQLRDLLTRLSVGGVPVLEVGNGRA